MLANTFSAAMPLGTRVAYIVQEQIPFSFWCEVACEESYKHFGILW